MSAHLIRMARSPDIEKYDISSLRFVSFAGAPFPAGVAQEVEERLGCPMLCFYDAMDSLQLLTAEPGGTLEKCVYTVGTHPS